MYINLRDFCFWWMDEKFLGREIPYCESSKTRNDLFTCFVLSKWTQSDRECNRLSVHARYQFRQWENYKVRTSPLYIRRVIQFVGLGCFSFFFFGLGCFSEWLIRLVWSNCHLLLLNPTQSCPSLPRSVRTDLGLSSTHSLNPSIEWSGRCLASIGHWIESYTTNCRSVLKQVVGAMREKWPNDVEDMMKLIARLR